MAGPGEDHEDDPVRRAAQYRVDREAARGAAEEAQDARDSGEEAGGAEGGPGGPHRIRMDERSRYVDTVIDQAIRRGEFDNLPLQGKPIPSIKSGAHDPDWWLKNLVEREQITGVLPSAQLRKDDAELDDTLDLEATEGRVRQIVTDFNARVVDARRQLQGGPPIVTPTRDVDEEARRWRARRAARRARSPRPSVAPGPEPAAAPRSRPWWKLW